MNTTLSPFVTAIVAAALVAFATTALGKVGGWLLLAVAVGMLILAAQSGRATSINGVR